MLDNETILFKYNVDENGNPVSIKVENEQKQVSINGNIQMEFIPDEFNSVSMLGENNKPMYEVFNRDEITANTYYVDYSSGVIYYDKSQFGKVKVYNYYGKGIQLIGASRIYDENSINGQTVIKTIQDLIDEGRKCLELIKSLGDAVVIINKLDQNIKTGTTLHENLVNDINIGTPLDASLKSNITKGSDLLPKLVGANDTATQKKQALDTSITQATNANEVLTNTNQSATQTNLTLQQTIATASEDIAKINATGNKSLVIGASQFINNQYTWTHNMNNDNLIVNLMDSISNEPLMQDYRIIDKNNILIRNSAEHPNIKVVLSASYYQGNAVIGHSVEDFAGDSIPTGSKKVRLRDVDGAIKNVITDSDSVYMTDGTTKLTKKISDINASLEQIKTEKSTKVELDIERKRIDNFLSLPEGTTVNEGKLEDIKIGADGTVFNTPATAVRNQLNLINRSIYDIVNNVRLTRIFPFKAFEQGAASNVNGYYKDNNDSLALPIRLRTKPQMINYDRITITANSGYQFGYAKFMLDSTGYKFVYDSSWINSVTIVIESGFYYNIYIKSTSGANINLENAYDYITVTHTSEIYDRLNLIENKINTTKFKDSNVLFIGDSITEVNFTATKNWTKWLSEWCQFKTTTNKAVGGSGIIRPTGGANWYDNVVNYGSGYDLILIMGNMNDFSDSAYFNNDKIGQFGDNTLLTQYGAVKLFIEKLITLYPTSKIGWITSTPRQYTRGDNDNSNPVTSSGYLWGKNSVFEKANKAIIETCEHYSIPVLDLFHTSNLHVFNSTNVSNYFYNDGNAVHPNNNGHFLIANKIFEFVNNNF